MLENCSGPNRDIDYFECLNCDLTIDCSPSMGLRPPPSDE